jgi:hypothetical protein
MRRYLGLLLLCFAAPTYGRAQLTTITASHLKVGGRAIATGQRRFLQ